MNELGKNITALIAMIIGVAILAVIVSRQSNTTAVIDAAGGFFNTTLGAALRPITGGSSIYSPGFSTQ